MHDPIHTHPGGALTAARQNELLTRYQWTGDGQVRVQAVHATDGLLRAAGVKQPRAFEWYLLDVERNVQGLLVLDRTRRVARLAAEQCEAFAAAEAGNSAGWRSFEVQTGPDSRVRVEVLAQDDLALPSPCEPELWRDRRATNAEVYSAVHALALEREIERLER